VEKDAILHIGEKISVYLGSDLDVVEKRKNLFRRESKFDFLLVQLLTWPLY